MGGPLSETPAGVSSFGVCMYSIVSSVSLFDYARLELRPLSPYKVYPIDRHARKPLEVGQDDWLTTPPGPSSSPASRVSAAVSLVFYESYLDLMGKRLFDAATAARVELTRAQQSHVNIPYITADQTGPKHLDVMLTRARVDRIIEPLLRKVGIVFLLTPNARMPFCLHVWGVVSPFFSFCFFVCRFVASLVASVGGMGQVRSGHFRSGRVRSGQVTPRRGRRSACLLSFSKSKKGARGFRLVFFASVDQPGLLLGKDRERKTGGLAGIDPGPGVELRHQ